MTYSESLEFLYRLRAVGIRLGLESTRALCAEIGNPEKSLKFIHIAGTNGKGSTAATLFSILKAEGYRAGLFTSPHLIRFNERIRINDRLISDEEVVQGIERLVPHMEFLKKKGIQVSFFEATTVLAFDWFLRTGTEIVILETGLGGRLDATNVVTPECSVITSISFDHERILGNTLPEIAQEKAGIIKKGVPVLISQSTPEIQQVFEKRSAELNAPLEIVPPATSLGIHPETFLQQLKFNDQVWETPLLGSYQNQNIALALQAAQKMIAQGWRITSEAMHRGIRETSWHGRFQILQKNPWLIIDGAHNLDGLEKALETWRTALKKPPGRVIFGVMRDKPMEEMCSLLTQTGAEIWLVPVDHPQRAMPPQEMAAFFKNPVIWPSLQDALSKNRKKPHPLGCFIVGSLYLVGEVLAIEKGEFSQPSLNG